MIRAYKDMMKNYTNFKGRLGRKDYWLATIFALIIEIIFCCIGGIALQFATASESTANTGLTIFGYVLATIGLVGFVIFNLVHLLPYYAATTRRVHDINQSGWWVVASIFIQALEIVVFVFCIMPSENENNNYNE